VAITAEEGGNLILIITGTYQEVFNYIFKILQNKFCRPGDKFVVPALGVNVYHPCKIKFLRIIILA